MSSMKKTFVVLVFVLLSNTAFAVTDAQVFAFAEANFPSLFAGNVSAGQYYQFNYRYYAASDNFLAIDTARVVYLLGSATGGALVTVGPVSMLEDTIAAWEASQTVTNYSGRWQGNFLGIPLAYDIVQNGNQLTVRSIPTQLTAEQTYTGSINGDTAEISTTDYAVATATLTAISSTSVKVVQNSCVAPAINAVYCMVPVGTPIIFTRQ